MTTLQKIGIITRTLYLRILNINKKPIFIIGTGRCGSDLLVDILSSNEDIQIDKDELYYWFLPALKDGKQKKPMLSDLVNYKLTATESLKKWTLFYRFKLKIMIENRINDTDKVFILKTPAITFILYDINRMFPKAKYIHLYRNGLAVSKSWFTKEYLRVKEYNESFTEHEFLMNCANYYNDSILEIDNFLEKVEEHRKLKMSYEQLTLQPNAEIARLLSFINVNSLCAFDTSLIKSTNYKINELDSEERDKLTEIMNQSLKLLGYDN